MDPSSELYDLENAFYVGQYSKVAAFDTSELSSPENRLAARVLILRARIALGDAHDVLAGLADDDDGDDDAARPELEAVAAFAKYVAGDAEEAVEAVEKLAQASSDNAVVQVLGGTVLHGAGKSEDALALLSKHQGSLEAVALLVQIHLQQNRTDLAVKEVNNSRRWAQDNLLVNFAESWVGLRLGGDRYQHAFYVFEEAAQAPATSSTKTLVGQAIAELHLGRLPEAEAALQQAMEKDATDASVLANMIVYSTIAGKDVTDLISTLQSVSPDHPLLQDLEEKDQRFDAAAGKYTARKATAARA